MRGGWIVEEQRLWYLNLEQWLVCDPDKVVDFLWTRCCCWFNCFLQPCVFCARHIGFHMTIAERLCWFAPDRQQAAPNQPQAVYHCVWHTNEPLIKSVVITTHGSQITRTDPTIESLAHIHPWLLHTYMLSCHPERAPIPASCNTVGTCACVCCALKTVF